MGEELKFELAGGPYAVTAARLALSEIDALVAESQAFDIRLLVSELVTNSVQHAQVSADDSIELRVRIGDDVIRVEVSDGGPGFERLPDSEVADQDRGWGLFFVSQLASRWGVGDPGNVWFEIERPEEEEAGQTAA